MKYLVIQKQSFFDLSWEIYEKQNGNLEIKIDYATSLFKRNTIVKFANIFTHFIHSVDNYECRLSDINIPEEITDVDKNKEI